MKRSGETRRPLARIYRIHQHLQEGRHPNCRTMGRDLEVSAKTVQRDIDFMRDLMRMPIAWDPVQNGFHYTEPVEQLPTFSATQEELMALFVARKVMEPLRGTAIEQVLRDGFQRLAQLSGAKVHLSWQELDHAFSIHEAGMAPADLALIEKLSTALVQHQKVFLRYKSPKRKQWKARTVHPLHLAQFQGGWYLFGLDEELNELRIFALPRMSEVEVLPEQFQPTAFNLDEYLKGSFGLMTDPRAKEHKVVLRFTGYAATVVQERKWHPQQKLLQRADGAVDLHLQLQHLDDLVRWVLSWGAQVQVLSPPLLRNRVKQAAREITRLYPG